MMRREGKGPPSKDLLVCFPTRAHLTLMPKRVCSPARRLEARRQLQHHHNQFRKSMRGGHTSPYVWSNRKQMGSDNLSEPTSPKVTCAGQIKVRSARTGSCKNWQTVMEEIERLHNHRKKKSTWVEALGFKKEVMHFLTCLRRVKFDFQCFGTFSHVDVTSDDEDEDDKNNKEMSQDQDGYAHDHDPGQDHSHDHDHDDHDHGNNQEVLSRTVFSKWFMVLQENQDCGVLEKDEKWSKLKETEARSCLPPSNALLLMRCRSAPAKSWLEERQEEQDDDDDSEHHDTDDDKEHHDNDEHQDEKVKEKENKKKKGSLLELMKNESDFYKLSCDIAKETWVIGGINKDPFSRSRSWKR